MRKKDRRRFVIQVTSLVRAAADAGIVDLRLHVVDVDFGNGDPEYIKHHLQYNHKLLARLVKESVLHPNGQEILEGAQTLLRQLKEGGIGSV